jgi:hypothetical protein
MVRCITPELTICSPNYVNIFGLFTERADQKDASTVSNKERAVQIAQLMDDLPVVRLNSYSPPFSHMAVEYFGPIETSPGRNRVTKRYGALFTCLATNGSPCPPKIFYRFFRHTCHCPLLQWNEFRRSGARVERYNIVAYSLTQTSIIETILGNDDKGTTVLRRWWHKVTLDFPTFKTTPLVVVRVESSWDLSGVWWVSRFTGVWWVSRFTAVGHCRPFSCLGSDGSACALVEAGLVQSQSQLR